MSYGMIGILLTGSLRSPPPFRLRRTFPHPGDRINRSMLSCKGMAPLLSTHSAPACGGKVVAPATKGGMHFLERSEVGLFSSGEARLFGFHRQRRHKKWRPSRAPTSPAQRYYISPEGESPQPVREASAGPGQNPWRPGPEARRRHQPSPAKAGVNLREYKFPANCRKRHSASSRDE